MFSRSQVLATIAFISCFALAAPVHADDIQMLPPVDAASGGAQGCRDGNNRVLTWDGNTTVECSNALKTDSSGDVWASGSIQVGTTEAECTKANAGGIRFNKSINGFEGCNGTNWQFLGGGATWVTIPPGTATASGGGWAGQYWNVAGNLSPTQWCQQNGYTAATGGCRSQHAPRGSIEGSMIANSFGNGQGTWAWACTYGYTDYWMDATSQILCTK